MKRAVFLALGTAFLMGCQDEPPTGPEFANGDNPLFEVQDASDGEESGHFFFLPPIVPAPDFEGVFNATRSPAVEICLVDQDMCAAKQPDDFPIVFTMDDGPGSEIVRVSAEDEHYIVNWHTKRFDLDPDATYRIRVLELAGELGVVDVVVGKHGGTLPIKFRIEEGLPFVVDKNGGTISAAGGDVVVTVPPDALTESEPVPVTVEEVPPEDETLPEGTDVLPGTVFDFGPEGTEFAEPVGITVAYDPAIIPAGVPEEGLRLFTLVDGRWELLLGGSVDIGAHTVTGFTDHFSTFGTLSISVFCSTVFDGVTSFGTFDAAFDAVIPGGTIEVCDGTHVVEGAVIDAPVTIQPEAGATPVIRNNTDAASFWVDGVSLGLVEFRNLSFDNQSQASRSYSIRPEGTYDQVIVDASVFSVSSDGFASARAGASTVPGARLSVQNSAFTGGNRALGSGGGTLDVINNMFNDQTDRALQFSSGSGLVQGNVMTNCGGLACIRPFQSDITVIGNTITGVGQSTALFSSSSNVVFTDNIVSGDFTFTAVQMQNGSTGLVERNTISGCGPRGCLRVFGGNVDFINNQLADATTDVDPFNHNLILFASGATGRIEGNTIDGCGVGSCILVIGGAVVYVVANDITIYEAHGTRFGIDGFGGIDPNDPASTPPTLFIEDNTIVGVGGTSETDPNNPSAYAIKESGIKIENGTATVFRNSVSNANSGFLAVNGGTFTDGSDNVLDQVLTGVASFNQSAATVHSSDFTNYRIALEGEFGAGSLTCNWWGSVLGPVNTQGVNQNAFTPWATAPVAGTSATTCSGSPPTQVRVAPAEVGIDPLAVATVAEAVSLVAPGGTILVADGTHVVQDVQVSKPVTIEAEGPGVPEINASGAFGSLTIGDVTGSGAVTIRGLHFMGANNHDIEIHGQFDQILIENSEFHPTTVDQFGSGITINGAQGNSLIMQNNAFIGGNLGVNFSNPNGFLLLNNTFTGQILEAIRIGGGSGRVEGNTISDCGGEGCISWIPGDAIELVGNQMSVDLSRPVFIAIAVRDFQTALIENNQVLGSVPGSIIESGINLSGGGTATVSGNRITNASNGLTLGAGTVVTGRDNIVENAGTAIVADRAGLSIRFSDLVGYASPLAGGGHDAQAFTCNWWGSMLGPVDIPDDISPDVYTPWATEPVAGTSATECSGGLP